MPVTEDYLVNVCHYGPARILENGTWVAVDRNRIIRGNVEDLAGWAEEWSFESEADASVVFDFWNGLGEPMNWLRHVPSGRRISRSATEVDSYGRAVGYIGAVYVRP